MLLDLPQSYEAPPALGFATSEVIFVFAKEDSPLTNSTQKLKSHFMMKCFVKVDLSYIATYRSVGEIVVCNATNSKLLKM